MNMCVSIVSVCMCVLYVWGVSIHACECSQGPAEGIRSPGDANIDGCELLGAGARN